ncbi:MAG: hypothetical protein ACI9JN_002720 [Bacteroidia bacterium]|jgi:hypothetical protein
MSDLFTFALIVMGTTDLIKKIKSYEISQSEIICETVKRMNTTSRQLNKASKSNSPKNFNQSLIPFPSNSGI